MYASTGPDTYDTVEFPPLGAQPSAAEATANAPPGQAPLKPIKTCPKKQKLPKQMLRSEVENYYWELHEQLVQVLQSVFPVVAGHHVLTYVLCEVSLPSLQPTLCGSSCLYGWRTPNPTNARISGAANRPRLSEVGRDTVIL